jgi:hypothetical protein
MNWDEFLLDKLVEIMHKLFNIILKQLDFIQIGIQMQTMSLNALTKIKTASISYLS